jgi:uncharacterized protein YbjT (DUF2867 family)
MTRLLIAGATGLVGSHVLAEALADARVVSVVAPTRKALAKHPKLTNPVSPEPFSTDADWWKVDGAVCTLGTTRADAGSAAAFRAVDLELQLKVAQQARRHGAERFALTSSMGADPKSRFLYLRTKGELEAALDELGWPSLTIVRPGAILGSRGTMRLGERLTAGALRLIGPVLPKAYRGNPAAEIARTLLEAAVNGPPGKRIIKAGEIG